MNKSLEENSAFDKFLNSNLWWYLIEVCAIILIVLFFKIRLMRTNSSLYLQAATSTGSTLQIPLIKVPTQVPEKKHATILTH